MNAFLTVAGFCALLCIMALWSVCNRARTPAEKLVGGAGMLFLLGLFFVLWFNAWRVLQ